MSTVSPLDVDCPACMVKAGNPCTRPTNTSRQPVSWFHLPREVRAEQVRDGLLKIVNLPDGNTDN